MLWEIKAGQSKGDGRSAWGGDGGRRSGKRTARTKSPRWKCSRRVEEQPGGQCRCAGVSKGQKVVGAGVKAVEGR